MEIKNACAIVFIKIEFKWNIDVNFYELEVCPT